jgi:hypothetical protein
VTTAPPEDRHATNTRRPLGPSHLTLDPSAAWWRYQAPQLAALGVIAILAFFWLGHGLPRLPWMASDSASYLEFSPVRPHGYAWFLAAYRLAFDDLARLPAVQLALYVGAVWLLAAAVGRRTQSLGAAAAVAVLAYFATDTTEFPYILSDSLYAAALIAGIACFLLYVDSPRFGLLLAGSGIGLAICFRVIGLALLPGLAVAILLDRGARRGSLARAAVLTVLPVALFCGAAASSQLLHHGRFGLGSWGGMDVLGKLPLLSRPVPEDTGLARLNPILDQMQPAREQLTRLNPLLEALAARQYYDHLRWEVVVPELERSWPEWREGDEHRRGRLAAKLATAYIAEDPLGFLRRTAIDLLGLWAMPRWLTEAEYDAASAQLEAIGELPFLSAFARTPEGQLDYYKIVPDPSDPTRIIAFRVVVLAFWALSLGMIALALSGRGRRALSLAPDLVLMVLVVHGVYAATALMEGVYARYIMPTWPLLVAGPVLALGLILRARKSQMS